MLRYAQASSRPFESDRALQPEPEPGAWVLVPSTAGYAAPRAGNDGHPRRGGRTRLVTTPEIARVPFLPFSRVQSGCTRRYCPLTSTCTCCCSNSGYLVSSTRCSSPDQPGIDSFRRSRQPPPCLSGRSTFFYLPLPRALPPFSSSLILIPFHLPGAYLLLPPSPSWGSRSLLFVPRRPRFASPLEAALLHTHKKKKNSIHPSIPPLPPRPGLASPHLLSPRIVRQAAVITGQATGLASHSQDPV